MDAAGPQLRGPAGTGAPPLFQRGAAGSLGFAGADLQALARRHGTPLHVYSAAAVRERIAALREALRGLDARICYAVKANPSRAVLALMAEAGLGADVVSGGELWRALRAGIAAAGIVFSGVGKCADEIDAALAAGIWKFNVESHDELLTLERVAAARGLVAQAAARINPDVDAGTHDKISTGRAGNKFGVSRDEARRWFAEADAFAHVRLGGLHVHIGSQIVDPGALRLAFEHVAALWRELARGGHRLASIDVGGGLGVCYRPGRDVPLPVTDYAAQLRASFHDFPGTLILEPGRWLVAEAGALLTRVVRTKPGSERPFVVVDAAMNDLLRPALYEAWHEIVAIDAGGRDEVEYDVVGPVCESSDTLAVARRLPRCEAGDLLAIATTGAYGASMASNYNSRPLAAEVMIDAGRCALVRARQVHADLVAGERAAVWEDCA